ncbi:MAG TPA: hypothetical protein VM468_11505 [Mycoplana sp.]|nr:hypothetical protein [Mycoplana sp.]
MRKLIMPAVGAFAVLAGLWSIDKGAPPDLDPVVSGSIRAEKQAGTAFSVSNIEAKTACRVLRGERLTHRSMRFTASGACEDVFAGLSHASTWTETGDGTAVVTDASGEAILTLAESDGLAYEVLDPPSAMITMSVTD